jgi:hypothetical protein
MTPTTRLALHKKRNRAHQLTLDQFSVPSFLDGKVAQTRAAI